ncbi:LytR/AlgR family response regulator transcription factor [Streptomonospora nanhaiensis]|uniref:LytR/AlgR family response regulator transcription factor n=1 Tax=Streptomonospora nanhaiensis TaxID=1323731 RepID=UPI001C385840|nr:LytTR family DNA-binding domain-containing protein [Streptomonospora nanhaiensis]MBV2365397.1 LytTR family DNA-binding domain-containing protein [Streptomonospora nanhaiensis]
MADRPAGLRVLAVDDVPLALEELCRLLREAPEVAEVTPAGDPISALRSIQARPFDAVFLDIAMPGLDGIELASLLSRLSDPPVIVFVTAYEDHALTAYGLGAIDYLLKPVRADRLATALKKAARLAAAGPPEPAGAEGGAAVPRRRRAPETMAAIRVETAGRTRYVRRGDVAYVEASGDYVRLHTAGGVHLVRMPISRLEEYWAEAGFARVHRGFMVALGAVRELRSDAVGGLLAHTDLGDVPVSRRHARELRARLLQAARSGELDRDRAERADRSPRSERPARPARPERRP